MTVRISTGARDQCLKGGLQAKFNGGFIYLYTGAQPSTPDQGATGVLLGKVTKNGDGSTGLTWADPVSGVMGKNTDVWQFTGLAAGTVGWFRISESADTPTGDSSTEVRVDGTVGTAGADANIANTNISAGAVSSVDSFNVVMPGA
jgi:hypothetical protein